MTIKAAEFTKFTHIPAEFVNDLKVSLPDPTKTLWAIYKHYFLTEFPGKLTPEKERVRKAIRAFLLGLVEKDRPEEVFKLWEAIPHSYHRDVIFLFHAYLQAHKPS